MPLLLPVDDHNASLVVSATIYVQQREYIAEVITGTYSLRQFTPWQATC